jgi:hypothetical protein
MTLTQHTWLWSQQTVSLARDVTAWKQMFSQRTFANMLLQTSRAWRSLLFSERVEVHAKGATEYPTGQRFLLHLLQSLSHIFRSNASRIRLLAGFPASRRTFQPRQRGRNAMLAKLSVAPERTRAVVLEHVFPGDQHDPIRFATLNYSLDAIAILPQRSNSPSSM